MLKTMPLPRLLTTEYRTLSQIRGPLVFVDRIADVAYNEIVEVVGPGGDAGRVGIQPVRPLAQGRDGADADHA